MELRIFECPTCSHRPRFGASRCSVCGTPTHPLNRKPVALLLLGCAALAVAVAVA